MATFDQITEMQKLIETLARCDLPAEWNGHDGYTRTANEDANLFYNLIEEARSILKPRKQSERRHLEPSIYDVRGILNGDTTSD